MTEDGEGEGEGAMNVLTEEQQHEFDNTVGAAVGVMAKKFELEDDDVLRYLVAYMVAVVMQELAKNKGVTMAAESAAKLYVLQLVVDTINNLGDAYYVGH